MAESIDLILLPVYRIRGQEWTQMPGLLATIPPKHPARGREKDTLIIHLALAGNAPLTSTDYSQIANQMAQRFYQVPGALTSAMRTTTEVLNQYLVERNMRNAAQGQHIIGRMILAVLREGQFTLAQSGPTCVFHLSGGKLDTIQDANTAGRGLGFGPSTPLHFSQIKVHPGDRMVFCSHYPGDWESGLPVQNTALLETLRRDLLKATSEDLNGVLLHLQLGHGNINILRGEILADPPLITVPPQDNHDKLEEPVASMDGKSIHIPNRSEEASAEVLDDTTGPNKLDPQPSGPFVHPLGTRPPTPAARTPESSDTTAGVAVEGGPAPTSSHKGLFVSPRQQADIPEIKRPGTEKKQKIYKKIAHILHSIHLFFRKTTSVINRFLQRILPSPDGNRTGPNVPLTALAAIAVPLVVITVAVMVYMETGKSSQYQENYNMAVNAAVGAIDQDDPAMLRIAWESAMHYIDEAEKYQVTAESQALRRQAENALDGLDGIIRLDFRAALYGGLAPGVKVTKMAANSSELYLLDSSSGKVLRASLGSQGYTLDLAFQCGPGIYGDPSQTVGKLIDLAVMPGGNDRNATIVAMDDAGTLLYCIPGDMPEAVPLAIPKFGWGEILGFTLSVNGREMYVMDSNLVWIYTYIKETADPNIQPLIDPEPGHFMEPVAFFSSQVPDNMAATIDLAANGNDLFLLFQDSHVTVCTYKNNPDVTTVCQDPASFTDYRSGHRSGTTLADAVFSQLAFDVPYNTALYLLEPNTHAVYKVSAHPSSLELGGQFHASWEQERKQFQNNPASAMAINSNRYLFLCIGNQVYFAALP